MKRRGFTLVEMLVVLVILAILMAVIGALIVDVLNRARGARTVAMVRVLHEGVERYRSEDASRAYPGPGGDNSTDSSKVLYATLGFPYLAASGTGIEPVQKPAMATFDPSWLETPGAAESRVIDPWGTPIRYHISNGPHLYATITGSPPGECATIVSAGYDLMFDAAGDVNDIGNWERVGTTH